MSQGPTGDVYAEARAELLKGRMPDLIWPALAWLFGVATGLFGLGQWLAGSKRVAGIFAGLSGGWLLLLTLLGQNVLPEMANLVAQLALASASALSIARLRRLRAKELESCRVQGRLPPQLQGLVLANKASLDAAPGWLYQGEQLAFEDQMRTGALEGLYNRFIASWVDFRIGILERLCALVEPPPMGPTLPFEASPSLLVRVRAALAAPLKRRLRFRKHYRRHANWRIYNTLEGLLTFLFSALSAAIAVEFEAWEYLVVLCLLPLSLALHRQLPRYRRFRFARLLARWDYFLSCLYHEQKPEPFIIALLKSCVRPFTQMKSENLRLEGKVYLEIAATVGLLSLLMTPVDLVVEWLREPDIGRLAVDVTVRQLVSTLATIGLTYIVASAYGNSILRYRHQGEASGQSRVATRALLGSTLGAVVGFFFASDSALKISQMLVDGFNAAQSEGILQHALLSIAMDALGMG